jgi:hypothetical protein
VCHDGREGHQGASFLCSNGTLFDQKEFTCNWWYKVDCREAPDHYRSVPNDFYTSTVREMKIYG